MAEKWFAKVSMENRLIGQVASPLSKKIFKEDFFFFFLSFSIFLVLHGGGGGEKLNNS